MIRVAGFVGCTAIGAAYRWMGTGRAFFANGEGARVLLCLMRGGVDSTV